MRPNPEPSGVQDARSEASPGGHPTHSCETHPKGKPTKAYMFSMIACPKLARPELTLVAPLHLALQVVGDDLVAEWRLPYRA